MKIQYILHADFETPGVIQQWAQQNQFEEKFYRPFLGESVPSPNDFDLLIVMGGPQSPLNIKEAPYLKDEISLIQKAIDLQIPILGFCLGAQLIGEALGAKTQHSPNKEVGVFPIELTKAGSKDPLLDTLPLKFPVIHWHNDMPGLTDKAEILAFSEGCPRQIIRYLPFVYGFQCHPEPTKLDIETMIEFCPDDLAPGKYVQTASNFLSSDFRTINEIMITILNNFSSVLKLNVCKTKPEIENTRN
jgi:GMP synthase (glutamine-hydrolysing)